jgi:hypothetical protein
VQTYLIAWKSETGDSNQVLGITSTEFVVQGLQLGRYRFYVYAKSEAAMSKPAVTEWAIAKYFTQEPGGVPLRMYEFASSNGAGLVLDPVDGGPKNISLAQNIPNPGDASLAIFVNASGDFLIGPAYALTQYANADNFDSTVYISDSAWPVDSLAAFYLDNSLDNYINNGGANAGNISAFQLPQKRSDTKGIGFVVRHTDANGNFHYARVVVRPDGNGNLLRGSAPDRHVQVEISYQQAPNLPYAKPRAGALKPAYHSTPQR